MVYLLFFFFKVSNEKCFLGKKRGRGRGRGRPPGRVRGRGRGRPRGRPRGSSPKKSLGECIVKLELEQADDELTNVTFFSALKSPHSLKTIKKEDIMVSKKHLTS